MQKSKIARIIRLKRGSRYTLAVQRQDLSLCAIPFWTVEQALLANSMSPGEWATVPHEVFSELHLLELPPGVVAFGKRSRRSKALEGVVLWGQCGLSSVVFSSDEAALEFALGSAARTPRNHPRTAGEE